MSSNFHFEDDDPTITDEAQTQWGGQDRILFLIDCAQDMQTPQENGKVPVKVAFDCVASVMLNKVFSSDKDEVGVILYGTASQNSPANHEHVYILNDMDAPSPSRIRNAEDLGSDGQKDLSEYGITTEEYPLGNVFWTCMDLLSENAKKQTHGTRRIFLITDQDNPHADNPSLRNAALQRAKDLSEVGITIELFGLNRKGHLFDESLFYNEILAAPHRQTDDDDNDPAGREARASKGASNNLDELLERVRRKRPKKRTVFKIPLRLSDGLEIGVKGYNTIIEQKRGAHRNVFPGGEQIKEVESITTYKCADTDQTLLPAEIKSYWSVAGGQSVFDQDERQKLRSISDPSIKLLGFTSRKVLRPYRSMAHPWFIYPDESSYEGSTRAFSALLDAMLEQKRVGLCVLTPRSNSSTFVVAMVPQRETKSEDGMQKRPPGFFLIRMPYADDIRDMPPVATERANNEEVEAAEQVLHSLLLDKPYDPADYENPALQLHYAVLQSLALEQPVVEKINDATLPRGEAMDKQLKNCVPHLKSLLNADEPEPSISRKRKESGDGEGSGQKRVRRSGTKSIEENYKDETLDHVSLYDKNAIHGANCTVPMLKEWLKEQGTYPKQRKADLIAQICDILDKRRP
ncbi:SPOC like C-terminal domain-containing protein [Zychaea mexicana]|uniref:SPOC like C-terminal domain-containing protein n=1 Tax=Zychaea mexicana TaxID=64656 RepID=UPI0022FF203F|nr:SPOC like C-terminal domain-containing protein [Zychaea mexicana]KAI9477090.1 SPOC like C-terminal domain-containing protein [Zychaea mexicana]